MGEADKIKQLPRLVISAIIGKQIGSGAQRKELPIFGGRCV